MKRRLALTINDSSCLNDPYRFARQVFGSLDIAETSRTEYTYRIRLFFEFVRKEGINHNSFLEFKRYLASRNDYSVSTKNKYLITAKVFLREMRRLGLLPVDVTSNVKSFTEARKHKRQGLTESEVGLISDYTHNLPSSKESTRLRAILCLLVYQGLRQVEITRLDVKHIDLAQKIAYVQGKGCDDVEAIDLHPATIEALHAFLRVNKIADGPLFTSRSNNNRNGRLTTKSIRMIVTTVLHDIGVHKSVHGFRHFFTTKLLETYKSDLLSVARYTRHKSLQMLQVYDDALKQRADLPRYYRSFQDIKI